MDLSKIILICLLIMIPTFLIVFAIIYTKRSRRVVRESQSTVSDKALIEFVNSQPDKIVNRNMIMEKFGLSKFEASGRLRHFLLYGILSTLRSTGGMKLYYTLAKPIDKSYDLDLTNDPFMTVEDLMMIFKHFDNQVSLQEICLVTGLPIKVILEEMKYFEKENIVNCLLKSRDNAGVYHQRIYTLREPYRSNPEEYMTLKDANFELKEIYHKMRNE